MIKLLDLHTVLFQGPVTYLHEGSDILPQNKETNSTVLLRCNVVLAGKFSSSKMITRRVTSKSKQY